MCATEIGEDVLLLIGVGREAIIHRSGALSGELRYRARDRSK